MICKHPPSRLYSWFAYDLTGKRSIPVVVCLKCRKILTGSA